MRVAVLTLMPWLALAPLHAQSGVEGSWRGAWMRAGDTLPVVVQLSRDPATGRFTGTFDADRLRASAIPFAGVEVRGCCRVRLTLRGDESTTEFTGEVRGDSLAGRFREGGRTGVFILRRSSGSKPSFEERDVTFASGRVTLAGTLITPRHGDSLAAVVFLHGSGGEGRWASRWLALQLAGSGVAALIVDKRGVGSSSGDWRTATLEELAGDGAAAVEWLRHQPRIAPSRVGLHGHSQGGTLAPMVAVRSGHVAFIVGSSAVGTPTDSTERYSVTNAILPAATSRGDSAAARAYVAALVAVAYHGAPRARLDSMAAASRGRPWFIPPPAADDPYWRIARQFGEYDPIDWWRRVHVPVLLLYGAADARVPAAASAGRITEALRQGAHRADVTVRLYPGADHTFRLPAGASGWPVTVPGYPDTLVRWLGRVR